MPPAPPDTPPSATTAGKAETLALRAAASAPLPSTPYLLVVDETSTRAVRLPAEGVLVVGRAEEAEVTLDDAAASRQHARLTVAAGTVVIEDLDSRNGTLVNGQRIQEPCTLATGDTINVGRVSLVLHAAATRAAGGRFVEVAQLGERAAEELARARRCGRTLAVIVLRVEPAGAPRAALAVAVAQALRPMELAAWTGPDEIAVLVPELGAAAARAYASVLRDALPASAGEVAHGCAAYATDGCDFGALLANARAAAAPAAEDVPPASSGVGRVLEIGDRRALVADPAMLRLFDLVKRLAASRLPVLVAGETGAGKELVALALHHWSPRQAAPFVVVNCAALPETLVESELFGHERGAFSGAVTVKPGLFEAASGGTVFLDEIGELSADAQSKLLRAIETHRVTRIGDVRERTVDIRVVTATNRDLKAEVEAGRFRRDLFFRLGAATVLLPPLRDRTGELPLLASAFLEEACAARGRPVPGLSPGAMERLVAHPWPGNVRELRNLMEYVAATVVDDVVHPWHLDRLDAAGDDTPPQDRATEECSTELPEFRPVAEELHELEQLRMSQALAATGGNQSRAAKLIHMPPRTFTHKLRQYQLPRRRRGPREGGSEPE